MGFALFFYLKRNSEILILRKPLETSEMEESMSIAKKKISHQIKISWNSFIDSLRNQDWGTKSK